MWCGMGRGRGRGIGRLFGRGIRGGYLGMRGFYRGDLVV